MTRLCRWASGPGAEPEGEETGWLAAQAFVVTGIDCGGLWQRTWFHQALDPEPGGGDLLAGDLEGSQPVPHVPALAPGLGDDPDVEVVPAVTQPVTGWMLAGQHQRAAGPQDPAQLLQRLDAVIDVFDGQRAQRQVDRCVGQSGDWVTEVVYTEVALAGPFPADFDHSGAVIEADDAGAAAQEFRRV